jgi:hypothetical protein
MTFLLTSTCKRFEQTGRESIECLIVVSILRNPTLSEIPLEQPVNSWSVSLDLFCAAYPTEAVANINLRIDRLYEVLV